MNHTYNPSTPYGTLMTGRPDEPESHRGIAVYNREEYEAYRKKGWLPEREFTERVRRATTNDW